MPILKILIDTKEKKSNYRSQLVRLQFEKLGYEVIQIHKTTMIYTHVSKRILNNLPLAI